MSGNKPPNPKDPESFRRKTFVISSGYRYSYIDHPSLKTGRSDDVVLLLHGFVARLASYFPTSFRRSSILIMWDFSADTTDRAYGWRYQIVDLVSRGYRTIAPDLLGYGGTSKPTDVKEYSQLKSCNAILEILDHENIKQKVIVVGHDWGSALTFRFVQYFPERVKCWVTICVPPSRPGQRGETPLDLEKLIRQHLPQLGYQLYFMSPEFSEEINRYRKTLILLLYLHTGRDLGSPILEQFGKLKNLKYVHENFLKDQVREFGNRLEKVEIKDPEISYILSEFDKGGLLGPLSWYKTRQIDHSDEQEASLPITFPAELPCLHLGASNDQAFPPSLFTQKSNTKMFPTANLTSYIIHGGNHFMHQDPLYRDQVTQIIGNWIDSQLKISRSAHPSHL
ncbi:hypothetical protein H4Q26_008214 [Puccinia striiformis f. sp. tritici PST-130]|nr:hypothetical protein H4Q26_008214 [Puccinia striiformis f. sp. tritici PST-130]